MTNNVAPLVYPLPLDARIDTFDRMDWFHGRFLRSDTVATAIDEKSEAAAFYSVLLWSASQEESPIGTIPISPVLQAQMVRLGPDVRRWSRYEAIALRGFAPLETPDGEPIEGRLGHPVTIEVARAAWDRHVKHEESKERRRVEKQRSRLRAEAEKAGISREEVRGSVVADLWLAWLSERGLNIASRYLRECRAAIFDGWRPAGEAENVVAIPRRDTL